MPTYEYGCKSCGYRFEEFQSISDDPIVTCPNCQEETVERLVSGGAGLIFRGSGFYITDYARDNSAEKSTESSGQNSKGTNGSDSTSSKDSVSSEGTKEKPQSDDN